MKHHLTDWKFQPIIIFYFLIQFSAAPSIGGRSRLVIDNAMKRDDGTYMCIAENQAGLRRALAAIRVKGDLIFQSRSFDLSMKQFVGVLIHLCCINKNICFPALIFM